MTKDKCNVFLSTILKGNKLINNSLLILQMRFAFIQTLAKPTSYKVLVFEIWRYLKISHRMDHTVSRASEKVTILIDLKL